MLIAHYLGVDHAGHKFGPRHPEMARKLGEVDSALRKLVSTLPEDCLLIVAGDHGMTGTGDHGGDSNDEVRAAMAVYSKRYKFKEVRGREPIAQVDLAPTLSLLTGVPIPYSSLGRLIVDLFADLRDSKPDLVSLLEANVEQVSRYLETYVKSGGKLPEEVTARIAKDVADFKNMDRMSGDKMLKGLNLLDQVRESLRSVWARFNEELIIAGITLAALQLAVTSALVVTPRSRLLTSIVNAKLLLVLSAFGAFGSLAGLMLTPAFAGRAEWIVGLAALSSVMAFGFLLLWKLSRSLGPILSIVTQNCLADPGIVFGALLPLLIFATSFSNSFVVQESHILSFFAVSAILFQLCSLRRPTNVTNTKDNPVQQKLSLNVKLRISPNPSKNSRLIVAVLILCGLVRLSNVYFRCREEQAPHCEQTEHHKPLGTLPRHPDYSAYRYYRGASTFVAATLAWLLPRQWLRRCGNLNGDSPSVTAAAYMPFFAFVCTMCFWALQVSSTA